MSPRYEEPCSRPDRTPSSPQWNGSNGVPVSSSKAAVKTWSTPTAQIQASRRTIKQVFEPAEIRVPVFEETQATRTVTNFEGFGCDLQSEVCRLLQLKSEGSHKDRRQAPMIRYSQSTSRSSKTGARRGREGGREGRQANTSMNKKFKSHATAVLRRTRTSNSTAAGNWKMSLLESMRNRFIFYIIIV